MAKVLAVFGATGQQGGSIIDFVLNDPELSKEYRIRAITRDVNSKSAQQLSQKKVEVVQGDAADQASLEKALDGAHTVFAMTNPTFSPTAVEDEFQAGKAIADAAVAKDAKYIIFSTLPAVTEITGGKYTKVSHYEGKVKAERYIRSLPVKSAFYTPGYFLQNFKNYPFMAPQKAADGSWYLSRSSHIDEKIPYIDVVADTGKFIGAILAEPDKYEGKTFCAASFYQSTGDLVATISKVTGKKVTYKQLSEQEFRDFLPFAQDDFVESFAYMGEFGFYGEDTEGKIEWAIKNARGKLSTLEDYLNAEPLLFA